MHDHSYYISPLLSCFAGFLLLRRSFLSLPSRLNHFLPTRQSFHAISLSLSLSLSLSHTHTHTHSPHFSHSHNPLHCPFHSHTHCHSHCSHSLSSLLSLSLLFSLFLCCFLTPFNFKLPGAILESLLFCSLSSFASRTHTHSSFLSFPLSSFPFS